MKKIYPLFLAAALLTATFALSAQASIPLQLTPMQIPGTPRDANDNPTEGYGSTNVQARINMNIPDGTEKVHFIRDNTDPYVITKAYPVLNADVFALRGYLLRLVHAAEIHTSPVQVDALKFNDGTALLLVSAEDYRFQDTKNGEGIDSIVKRLDRKDLEFRMNTDPFVYFPKINSAADMMERLKNVGASRVDKEFAFGMDSLMVDSNLNALVFCTPRWSQKHIRKMLKAYDTPLPEVRISFRVYEVYTENDDKIGLDFQSWKNNDGVDFFSAGARVRRNWTTLFTGGPTHNHGNSTAYWNFEPKWNTRYFDFLASNGHAKLMSSGVILAKNREESKLEIDYGFFYDRNDLNYKDPNPDIIPRQPVTKMIPQSVLEREAPNLVPVGNYWRVLGNLAGDLAYDGTKTLGPPPQPKPKMTPEETKLYQQQLEAWMQRLTYTEELNRVYSKKDYTTSNAYPGVIHGKMQLPMASDGFKFVMTVNPVVTSKGTRLHFDFSGVSLIGWNSDGTPRLSSSTATSRVQLYNGPQELIVDDIQKVEIVRSVAGLPFFKDLPVLGWLFADESESTKKTKIVVALRAEYSTPDHPLPTQISENVGKIVEDVERMWKSPVNNMGFQQILLDTDKWE